MSFDGRRHNPTQASDGAAGVAPGKRTNTQSLQRRASGSGIAPDAADAVDLAAGSSGAPLPGALRARFESSLNADLSGVRIHTGTESANAARAVGARAYTTGNDIHFGAGQHHASDPFAVHLLAHEVAHTVQQSQGATGTQHKLDVEVSEPGDASEREADHAADAMLAGVPARVSAASPENRVSRWVIQRDTDPNTPSPQAPSNNVPTSMAVLGPENISSALVSVPGAGAIIERLRPDTDATLPLLRQWRTLDEQVAALAQAAGIDPTNASNPQLRQGVQAWRDQLAHNIAALPPAAANVQTQAQSAQVQYQAKFTIGQTRLQNLQRNRIALEDAHDAMLRATFQAHDAQGQVDAQQQSEEPRPHTVNLTGDDLLSLVKTLAKTLLQAFGGVAAVGGDLLTAIGQQTGQNAGEGVNDSLWTAALGNADAQANTYSQAVQRLMAARADAQAALAGKIVTFCDRALACQNEWTSYRTACIDLHAARQELNIQTAALGAAGNQPGGATRTPASLNMTAALNMYNKMQDREQLAVTLEHSMADHAWTHPPNLGALLGTLNQMVRYDVPDGTAWGRFQHAGHDVLVKFIEYSSWDELMPSVRDQLQQLQAWGQQRPAQQAQFAQWQALLGPITAAPAGTADQPLNNTANPPPTPT